MSTTTIILSEADMAAILAQNGCTPEYKMLPFCRHKHGQSFGIVAFACRADGTRVPLGMWEAIRDRSEGELQDLVKSKLREATK